MSLYNFNQTLTVAGSIVSVDPAKPSFSIQARSGNIFEAVVGSETNYLLLPNLDGLERDRVPEPQNLTGVDGVVYNLHTYAEQGRPVSVRGIYQQHDGASALKRATFTCCTQTLAVTCSRKPTGGRRRSRRWRIASSIICSMPSAAIA